MRTTVEAATLPTLPEHLYTDIVLLGDGDGTSGQLAGAFTTGHHTGNLQPNTIYVSTHEGNDLRQFAPADLVSMDVADRALQRVTVFGAGSTEESFLVYDWRVEGVNLLLHHLDATTVVPLNPDKTYRVEPYAPQPITQTRSNHPGR